jgi:hypothetical protein
MSTIDKIFKVLQSRTTLKSNSQILKEAESDFEVIIIDNVSEFDRRKKINELKKQGFTAYPKQGKYDYTIIALKPKSKSSQINGTK